MRNGRDDLATPPTFEGLGTGTLDVRVVDPEALTEHRYRVAFTAGSNGTSYDVTDVTTGDLVLDDVPVADDGTEGPLFDGLRLVVYEDQAAVDPARTDWAEPDGLLRLFSGRIDIDVPFPREWQFQGAAAPYDYEVRFSDDLVGESMGGFQLGTGSAAPDAVVTETNFTVWNTTLDRPAPFAFYEPDEASRNGRFDAFEYLFLYEDLDGDPEPTYVVRPETGDPDGAFPAEGDVFALRSFKPFATGDAFRFTASQTTDAEDGAAPSALRLDAAFPNPARRTATLTFEIERAAGAHTVRLDTAGETRTRRLTVLQ